jgi:hypothetical protein
VYDHIEIEAVMGNALETLTRYQTKLKRDLFKGIEMLRSLQAERRERERVTSDRSDRGMDWPNASPGDVERRPITKRTH